MVELYIKYINIISNNIYNNLKNIIFLIQILTILYFSVIFWNNE